MPELPEVAALADRLTELTAGSMLAAAELAAISVLKTFDPPLSHCVGQSVVDVTRRGKFLCWQLSEAWLVMHLARAGWLKWSADIPARAAAPRRGPLMLRLAFASPDGEAVGRCDLTEAGTRKSSSLYVVTDPGQVPGVARLGPDPLSDDFTLEVFARILAQAGRSQIKGVLRDQSVIAGVGNAYSDEILHAARMSPFKPASSLSADETGALFGELKTLLAEAVARARLLPMDRLKDDKRTNLRVHARAGLPCPVCSDTVREVSFADSSLQYCPTCQTGGKPLADRRLSRLLK